MKTLTISHNLALKYPGLKVSYAVLEGLNVLPTPPRLKKQARASEKEIRDAFSGKGIDSDAIIDSWKQLANRMHISDSDSLPAQIGLIARVLGGREIWKINNIVDSGNIVALKSRSPVGMFDYDKICDYIALRESALNETYIPLLASQSEIVTVGEVVYSDSAGIFSRYCKDSDRTKITESTVRILTVIDGTPEVSIDTLEHAKAFLLDLIKLTCPNLVVLQSDTVVAALPQ
jgi:DNA/RNA-binding domain of Phe-tRNA-synthetase-like protein